MRLKSLFLLLMVPLIVAPMLLLGWLAFDHLQITSKEKTLQQVEILTTQVGLQLNTTIHSAYAAAQVISSSTLLKKYVTTKDEVTRFYLMQRPLLNSLYSYQTIYPEYYEIRIIFPDGYEEVRAQQRSINNVTDEEADTPFFKLLSSQSEQPLSMITQNPDDGKMVLYVGKPLILRDPSTEDLNLPPTLRAYLVLTVSLDHLTAQINSSFFSDTGHLFITNGQGETLFHPEERPTQYNSYPHSPMNEPFINAKIFEKLRNNAHENKPAALFRLPQNEQELLYILSRRVSDNLYIFGQLPEQELKAASLKLAQTMLLLLFAVILITVLSVYFFINQLLIKPIGQLNKAAHEIGRGHFHQAFNINAKGELASLADSFKEMCRNLDRSAEQAQYLAYHDSLTGLPNRLMFKEYLEKSIAQAHRQDHLLAIIFLDLDNFKRINDTLGHQAGDDVLNEVAERLSNCLRSEDSHANHTDLNHASDLIARLAGDEFTIILPMINDPVEAGLMAQRIIDACAEPITTSGKKFHIGASLGIAVSPLDGKSATDLMKHADLAMYQAKQQGKNSYQYYSPTMDDSSARQFEMESCLRNAIENDEFHLVYQPIFDMASNQMIGVETLIRWESPVLGAVPPDEFIPLAESTGMIVPIGKWIMEQACLQSKYWQDEGINLHCSVNVSAVQIQRDDFCEVINEILTRSQLRPEKLHIELTETSLMMAQDNAITVIKQLKEMGIKLSMDDFGTGYSSFDYLRHFPLDIIKIDRNFVKDIGDEKTDEAIISAIIAMAHILDMVVVAEGIETQEQFDFLRGKSCDFAQGYLLQKPTTAIEISYLMTAERSGT